MSLPDISNTVYGFFFVTTAVSFGLWRLFQHGVHKSVETHLQEQREEFMAQLKVVTDLLMEMDRRTGRIEYALYNDGKTGLVNKVDDLLGNQQEIKIDVEVLKARGEK